MSGRSIQESPLVAGLTHRALLSLVLAIAGCAPAAGIPTTGPGPVPVPASSPLRSLPAAFYLQSGVSAWTGGGPPSQPGGGPSRRDRPQTRAHRLDPAQRYGR